MPRSQISEAFELFLAGETGKVVVVGEPGMSAQRCGWRSSAPGGWGEQHARIFAGRHDTELVAIVGRTPEREQQRAAAYGTTGLHDIEQMLADARPDLVTMSLPNEGHFEPTLEVIEPGFRYWSRSRSCSTWLRPTS